MSTARGGRRRGASRARGPRGLPRICEHLELSEKRFQLLGKLLELFEMRFELFEKSFERGAGRRTKNNPPTPFRKEREQGHHGNGLNATVSGSQFSAAALRRTLRFHRAAGGSYTCG